ncbi:hypothetical protein NL676_027996 [Syzygium grande]|nr:hypothetical protein NL676_027996 [Syzygium grande]
MDVFQSRALLHLLALNVVLLPLAHGIIHFYDFVLKEQNYTKLCVTKSVLTLNGSFPGPEIRVHKGDTGSSTFTTTATTASPSIACWYKESMRELPELALDTGLDTPRSDAYTINGEPGDTCACSSVPRQLQCSPKDSVPIESAILQGQRGGRDVHGPPQQPGDRRTPVNVPQNVTKRMFVLASMGVLICPNSSCGGIYGDRMAASLNNFSWVNPSIDILQAYYRNISDIYSMNFADFPGILYNFTGDNLRLNISVPTKGTAMNVFDFNEMIEIVFQGMNAINATKARPMHLHGYAFYVIVMASGTSTSIPTLKDTI